MDNNGITGEYRNTIDEKGRIMFPVKARTSLPENRLIITRGMDNCLWLFPPAEWEKFSEKIMKSASLSKAGYLEDSEPDFAKALEALGVGL